MSDFHYGPSTISPTGPPPPPPPKPYSQDHSRTGTPVVASTLQQNRLSQQFSGQPPVPPHPPLHVQSPPPQSPPIAGPATGSQIYQRGYPNQYQSQQYNPASLPQQQSPHLAPSFELPESITKHTTTDLSKLLSEPQLLDALAQAHPAYSAALQPLQAQIHANTALAAQLLGLEGQLKDLREKTGQLMLQHTSLQTQWRRKQAEMDEALAPWGPRAMYQRLLASISDQEAMLTAVQESFIDGGGPDGRATEKEVTEWVKRIRDGAAALEKRREMRARWDEGRVGGWR